MRIFDVWNAAGRGRPATPPAPTPAQPAPPVIVTGAPVSRGPVVQASEAEARAQGERLTIIPPRYIPQTLHPDPAIAQKVALFVAGKGLDEETRKMRSAVLDAAGVVQLLDDAEAARLRELQIPVSNLDNFLLELAQTRPSTLYARWQEQIANDVASGKGHEVSAMDGWTQEDFAVDKSSKIGVMKAKRRELCAPALPIAYEVAKRIGQVSAVLAERFAAEELARAKQWGVDYAPSKLVVMLRYIALHPLELVPPGSQCGPANILKWAGITL